MTDDRRWGGPRPDLTLGRAASMLVGSPFRLHGRDPNTGLDCVGLVASSLATIGKKPVAPSGYSLRNVSVEPFMSFAERSALVPDIGPLASSQILLVSLGYGQHHLMITVTANEAVHAHAGLRRVVRHRLPPDLQIIAKWRPAT